MTTPEQVAAYDRLVDAVVGRSQADLARAFPAVDFTSPALAREDLRTIVQAIVDVYGPALAEGGLAWYQTLRPVGADAYDPAPVTAEGVEGQVDGTVRYAAGMDPGRALTLVAGTTGRIIQTQVRQSVLEAAERDPLGPAFARVPRGKTCAFCSMLASRGFVYTSEELAGGAGHEYHDFCDCRIVPSFQGRRLVGYDPDALYKDYLDARKYATETAGNRPLDHSMILSAMRAIHPGRYTDGHGEARSRKPFLSSALETLAQTFETEERAA